MHTKKIRITLIEELLGTKSANKDLLATHVLTKANDVPDEAREEELLQAAHIEDASTSIFDLDYDAPEHKALILAQHKAWCLKDTKALDVLNPQVAAVRKHGHPVFWDYMLKGFFKDACGALRVVEGTKSKGVKAYKKNIDGLIFPAPRKVRFQLPEGGFIGVCERPLRVQTMQGERVALARSETVPEGSTLDFEITYLTEDLWPWIEEMLNYGRLRGLGQWRNSGKGRFSWEERT